VCESDLMAPKELVLLATRAIRALEAANQEHSHAHSYQDGQHIRVDREPMNNAMHKPRPLFKTESNSLRLHFLMRRPKVSLSGKQKCTTLSPPQALIFA